MSLFFWLHISVWLFCDLSKLPALLALPDCDQSSCNKVVCSESAGKGYMKILGMFVTRDT